MIGKRGERPQVPPQVPPGNGAAGVAPTALGSVFFAYPGLPAWADVWRAGPPGLMVVMAAADLSRRARIRQ